MTYNVLKHFIFISRNSKKEVKMRSLIFVFLSIVLFISSCSESVLEPDNTIVDPDPKLNEQQWIDLCVSDQEVLNMLKQDAEVKGKFIDLMNYLLRFFWEKVSIFSILMVNIICKLMRYIWRLCLVLPKLVGHIREVI